MAFVITVSEELWLRFCWPKGSLESPCPLFLEESSSTATSTGRLSAETIPVVTVLDRPRGAPIAMTGAPTVRCEDEPKRATVRSEGGLTSRMTARSVVRSWPTTSAS